MTNITNAIDRLRQERRDAQNQVQKLGEAISVLEKLTRGSGSTTSRGVWPHPADTLCSWSKKNLFGSKSALGQNSSGQKSGIIQGGPHRATFAPD